MSRRRLLALAAGSLAARASAGTAGSFHRDLSRARAGLHGRSTPVATSAGTMKTSRQTPERPS